jgi:hypothetical protein
MMQPPARSESSPFGTAGLYPKVGETHALVKVALPFFVAATSPLAQELLGIGAYRIRSAGVISSVISLPETTPRSGGGDS